MLDIHIQVHLDIFKARVGQQVLEMAYNLPRAGQGVCHVALGKQARGAWRHECATQPTLRTPTSPMAFFIFAALSHKIMWTRCLSIPQLFSIFSIACWMHSAVWDPRNSWACRVAWRKTKLESIHCAVRLSSDIGATDELQMGPVVCHKSSFEALAELSL